MNQHDDQTRLICRHYEGCTAGDLDMLREEVVHYFLAPNPGAAPVRGREHLARYWRKVPTMSDACWVVEAAVTMGKQTVIEWSLFWRPESGSDRIATRGAEWFVFCEGLIFEIRFYYLQRPETTELDAFPYAERGYSVLERERSELHPEAGLFAPPVDDRS